MNRRAAKNTTGFSLVEVLMNLVFSIFLVSVAVPSFSDYLQSSENFSVRQNIREALESVKNTAIHNQRTVSICPLGESGKCGSNWANGWLVFQDDGQGETGIANDGILNGREVVVQTIEIEFSKLVTVTELNSNLTVQSIKFNEFGYTESSFSDSKSDFLIAVCNQDKQMDMTRGLVLSHSGQISFTRDYDNDGIEERLTKNNNEPKNGNELRCS